MPRVISSFKELKLVVAELQEQKVSWAKHYLDQYITNINSPEARLEYLYRLLQILRKYDIRLTTELIQKLMDGELGS